MRQIRTVVIALTLAAVACSTSQGGVVFSNTSGSIDANVPVGTTGADWSYAAQQFFVGANTTVTDVTLSLSRVSTSSGTFNVEIWSTASNLPGSLVGILSQNQSPSIVTSNNQLVNFSGNVSVTPSLAYWVVLNAQDGSSSQVLWNYTNDAPSTSGFVGVTGTEILVTTDPPVNWAQVSGVTQGRLMMDVTAVPEPTAFALAGVGACLVGLAVGKRRLRPSACAADPSP